MTVVISPSHQARMAVIKSDTFPRPRFCQEVLRSRCEHAQGRATVAGRATILVPTCMFASSTSNSAAFDVIAISSTTALPSDIAARRVRASPSRVHHRRLHHLWQWLYDSSLLQRLQLSSRCQNPGPVWQLSWRMLLSGRLALRARNGRQEALILFHTGFDADSQRHTDLLGRLRLTAYAPSIRP